MAEIRVNYRRVWQVKPFETESCELGLTVDPNPEDPSGVEKQAAVFFIVNWLRWLIN